MKKLQLREIIKIINGCYDIIHNEIEICGASYDYVELTELGEERFKKVLDSEVIEINLNDKFIVVGGCSDTDLEYFLLASSGNISSKKFDEWFIL